MITFAEFARMFDATHHMGLGFGMITLLELAHMFDATHHKRVVSA